MKVYFAGKIPKGDEIGTYSDWRAELAAILNAGGNGIEVLSPENAELDESDSWLA